MTPELATNPSTKPASDTAHSFAKGQLKAIIKRIEKLEEEKKAISDDIKDIYGEAKGNGFDVKALRTIIRMRKQDASERARAGSHYRHIPRGFGDVPIITDRGCPSTSRTIWLTRHTCAPRSLARTCRLNGRRGFQQDIHHPGMR